jgi:hypothetical protein
MANEEEEYEEEEGSSEEGEEGEEGEEEEYEEEEEEEEGPPVPESLHAIAHQAVSRQDVDGGEHFWELDPAYGQELLGAMTSGEKDAKNLPGIGGKGAFLDKNIRAVFTRIGASMDGAHSWGMFSYQGSYFLTRLSHHTWTTKVVDGKVVKVPGSYVGVEAYRIPADLATRIQGHHHL